MKKTISIFLAVSLIIGSWTCIYAEDSKIYASTVDAEKKSEISVDVMITGNPGIASATLTVGYDNTALKLKNVVDGGILGAKFHTTNYNLNPYYLTWANDTATTDFTTDGTLATLVFDVLDTAVEGKSYPVTLYYDYENYDIYNCNVEPVNIKTEAGAVVVKGPDAPESKIISASVFAGSDFTLNIEAKVDATVEMPMLRVLHNGKETELIGFYDETNEVWCFAYSGINSQCLADQLTLTLLNDEGKSVDVVENYSIRDYCDQLYNMSAEELGITNKEYILLITLLADILEYGAASQKYANHNLDNLANDLVWVKSSKTSSLDPPSSDLKTIVHTSSENDAIKTASLYLSSDVRFSFSFKAENATQLVISNGKTEEVIDVKDLNLYGDLYRVYSSGLFASSFGDVYTITLRDANTIYHQITYSVNSYVISQWNSTTTVLSNIVKAIYNYGTSAAAYIN